MSSSTPLPLHLSPERLDEFCDQLRRRASDPAAVLQSLTTIQALLAVAVVEAEHPAWREARSRLNARMEEARDAVLEQHAVCIAAALEAGDGTAIGHSFTRLSRSGFADAATLAWSRIAEPQRTRLLGWLNDWLTSARERSAHAGKYPDAPDFRSAGIALDVYLGLQELQAVALRFEHYGG